MCRGTWSGERLKVIVYMKGVTPLMHSIHAQKMMDIVMVALVVMTMMTMVITEIILERDIVVAKMKGSLLCVRVFESVYTWTNICYGQARFQEHP